MDIELIEKQLKQAISIVQEMKSSQNGKTSNVGTLKTLLIEVVEMLEADYESDDESLESDYDSDSDASFTQEESTYIKNESHRAYLKRYSLKPQFPLHYYNADRDK
jgi:hypothetical protein